MKVSQYGTLRTFKVSSSAVVKKTIKPYNDNGSHEDCHKKGRTRVTSAGEDKSITAPQIAAQIIASQSSSNRHLNINCLKEHDASDYLASTNHSTQLRWFGTVGNAFQVKLVERMPRVYMYSSTSQKFGHLFIPGFVFFLNYFLHCRIIVKTSKL